MQAVRVKVARTSLGEVRKVLKELGGRRQRCPRVGAERAVPEMPLDGVPAVPLSVCRHSAGFACQAALRAFAQLCAVYVVRHLLPCPLGPHWLTG